jgi:hypothetical protein
MYNHFAALVMSSCLISQCGQVIILSRQWHLKTSHFKLIFRWIYWTVITLTTFIAGVGWAISGKPNAAAIQFLAAIDGMTGCTLLFWKDPWHSELLNSILSKWYQRAARGLNRFFKIIHTMFNILFAAGAIILALQFRYQNL